MRLSRLLHALVLCIVISANLAFAQENLNAKLLEAAGEGNLHEVRALLKKGADVNAKSILGETALMEAAAHGHAKVVNLLLKKGADVNAKDSQGLDALYYATGDHPEIVRLLKKAGAE